MAEARAEWHTSSFSFPTVQTAAYRRTLRTLVSFAAQLAHPADASKVLVGGHAVEGAYFFHFADDSTPITVEDVLAIQQAFDRLVDADKEIETGELPFADALDYFRAHGLTASAALITSRVQDPVKVVTVGGHHRLRMFPFLRRTGEVAQRRPILLAQDGGVFLVFHNPDGALEDYSPSTTLMASFRDHMAWGRAHACRSVGQLNALQAAGSEVRDFVLHAEFRQEAKLAAIAEDIDRRRDGSRVRVICIAGPTSSGKTTFAQKLTMYLANKGYRASPLSVDAYYLPLDRQPKYLLRQKREDIDYDHLESVDLALVYEHISQLLNGKSVDLPNYSMKTGFREPSVQTFRLAPGDNSILVIEGIHALNPEYTRTVAQDSVYRIYISPLSALQLDETNAIRTTDHRLLRCAPTPAAPAQMARA